MRNLAGRPAGKVVLDMLRRGHSLGEAATIAGVTVQAVKQARHADPVYDSQVVAAAHLGGSKNVRPLRKPPCPGRACGTPYGYQMIQCRRGPCRQAVATSVGAWRARQRGEDRDAFARAGA